MKLLLCVLAGAAWAKVGKSAQVMGAGDDVGGRLVVRTDEPLPVVLVTLSMRVTVLPRCVASTAKRTTASATMLTLKAITRIDGCRREGGGAVGGGGLAGCGHGS